MSNIIELKQAYQEVKNNVYPLDTIFDFKELLLSSDSPDFLDFHFEIMNDKTLPKNLREMIQSFFWAEALNERDSEKVSEFLYNKYNKTNDTSLKLTLIQILGHLRSKYAKELALKNIFSKDPEFRYRSIIVLGWVGKKNDLNVLNQSLLSDSKAELRGFSATAMRQIWYNHKSASEDILTYLYEALKLEKSEITLGMIIIVIQDLLRRKFGLQEKIDEGIIKGDVIKAKAKIIKTLDL